jgi:hypothetical protein
VEEAREAERSAYIDCTEEIEFEREMEEMFKPDMENYLDEMTQEMEEVERILKKPEPKKLDSPPTSQIFGID